MIEPWYRLVETLPFSWAHYVFMKNALLAVLLVTPLFALLGTMVVSNRMAFFTDVLGHSALTGIAIGVLLGLADPMISMVGIAVVLSVVVNMVKNATRSSMDTVLGVFFAFIVAVGIVVLSRQGGFVKYTGYLIGDILAVTPLQIAWFFALALVILAYWFFAGNALMMSSINTSWARSRRIPTFVVETSFTILVALVVMMSIRLVGILIINSLLILPAAAGRNIARDMRSYTLWAVIISVLSGISGLIISYYWGTASGATIVLIAALCYSVTAVIGAGRRK